MPLETVNSILEERNTAKGIKTIHPQEEGEVHPEIIVFSRILDKVEQETLKQKGTLRPRDPERQTRALAGLPPHIIDMMDEYLELMEKQNAYFSGNHYQPR